MSVKRIRCRSGLVTDPSALEDLPDGAMLQADNVMVHRHGVVQPRPGFGDTSEAAARSTNFRPVRMWAFGGDLVIQSVDSTDLTAFRLERGSVATVYSTAVAPSDTAFRGTSDAAEARGSLYVTSSTGVQKLVGVSASALTRAGVTTNYTTPGIGLLRQGSGSDRYAIGTQSVVAYRYCWVSEDANGYVRRSAPSPRISSANTSASIYRYAVFDKLYLPTNIGAGDKLEIYRTRNATPETADPGDEMFLAVTHEITSAEASQGYLPIYTIVDQVLDDELGESLYTNASREGILSANERPPLAYCLAQWRECMWYGNTQERHTLTIDPIAVYDKQATLQEYARDGAHYSSFRTGDFASADATVTNVDAVGGMKVGQYITSDSLSPTLSTDTYVPALTTITSITTTLTVNNNTNVDTATPDSFEFTGISAASTEWQSINMDSSLTQFGLAQKGASATETAANIASAINATFAFQANITATSSGAVVTINDDDGHGVPIVITESTGGTYTVAYEIEMSANAKATGSTQGVACHDYITVGGVDFYFSYATSAVSSASSIVDERLILLDNQRAGGEVNLDQCRKLIVEICDAVNAYSIENPGTLSVRAVADAISINYGVWYGDAAGFGPTSIVLIRETPGDGSFTFEAPVRPESFRVRGGEQTSEDTRRRNRIFFSKPGQPEAVPPINFVDLGDEDADILALVPLRDALLVWKEDGLFRITGNAPAGWVIDEVDLTLRLVAPNATAVLENTCYAWTDRGVAAVTEGGVGGIVSTPIASTLREIQRAYPLDASGVKRGVWMERHQRLGLIVLGISTSLSADYASYEFVWSKPTGAWTKWLREDRCATYDPAEDRMAVSPAVDAWAVRYERDDGEDDAASYRDETVTTTMSVSGTVITEAIASFGGFTPAVGDVFVVAGSSFLATDVTISGADYKITVDGTPSQGAGSVTWHQGIPAEMFWSGVHMPGSSTRWHEIHAQLVSGASAYLSSWTLELGGRSEWSSSTADVDATISSDISVSRPVRVGPPRDIVRAAHLFPYARVRAAGVLWRLAELHLLGNPTSRRLRR